MGFLTTQDRIGNVSYSSGIITLQPSLLTIGGQQYRTPTLNVSLSGLTANTLYMLYVVMTGPTSFQLVVSGNFNSSGPNGYNRWKLVGAFVSNGITGSIAFGAFFDPYLTTKYDWVPYTPVISAAIGTLTNYGVPTGSSRRDGTKYFQRGFLQFNGAVGTWQYPQFQTAGVVMSNGGLSFYRAGSGFSDVGSNSYGGYMHIGSNYFELESYFSTGGGAISVSNTSPFVWSASDVIMLESPPIDIPSWSNTPIAYL